MLVIAWMGFIFFLSSQPKLPSIPGLDRIDWNDKIKHFVAYAILGTLIWRALASKTKTGWTRLLLTVAISTVYGMTDEFHQRFVPNRSCDICDLAADALGAFTAAVILLKWRRYNWQTKRKKRKPTR